MRFRHNLFLTSFIWVYVEDWLKGIKEEHFDKLGEITGVDKTKTCKRQGQSWL